MQVNKYILILILIILSLPEGCVDPYYPDINDALQSIVIQGTLTDKEGYHYIRVSRSVPYNTPKNVPLEGCSVEIIDNAENIIHFYESEPGLYEQWIDQEYLKTGKQYKLRVTTSDAVYESKYETMLPCPPVQNVYYEIKEKGTADPDYPIYGIQFFTDLVVPDGYARNYRWELEETWEYHAEYLIFNYYDGTDFYQLDYGTDSLYYCWSSESIHEIYTGTINHITEDSLYRIPLRYVSNETDRLKVKYSLLIKQYSLNDTAYEYWNKLKKQSQETGGLYETQPQQVRGNISNINDDNEIVLGFFNVSGLSEKRIFVSERFHFFPPSYECVPWDPFLGIPKTPVPIYFTQDWLLANRECFNCTLRGGTIYKPDFWE
jgi:hypothetical protein